MSNKDEPQYPLPENFIETLSFKQCSQVGHEILFQDERDLELRLYKRQLETAEIFDEWSHLHQMMKMDADKAEMAGELPYIKIFETAQTPDDWWKIYRFSAKNDEDKQKAKSQMISLIKNGCEASFHTLISLAYLLNEGDDLLVMLYEKAAEKAERDDQWKIIRDRAPLTSSVRNLAFTKVKECEEKANEHIQAYAKSIVAHVRGDNLSPIQRFFRNLYRRFIYWHDLIVFSITLRFYTKGLADAARTAHYTHDWMLIYLNSHSWLQRAVALRRQRQFVASPSDATSSYEGLVGQLPAKHWWHRFLLIRKIKKMEAEFIDWYESIPMTLDLSKKPIMKMMQNIIAKMMESATKFEEHKIVCSYVSNDDKDYPTLLDKMSATCSNIGHWFTLQRMAEGHPKYQKLALEKIQEFQKNTKPDLN